jgi:hypothetical protein
MELVLRHLTTRRVALLATLAAAGPYLLTVNRTFGFIDKGELAAVASTIGVAHPTGYPTIMAIGYAVTHLLPLRPVLALNLLAASLAAASAGTLTLLFDDLLRRPNENAAAARSKSAHPHETAAARALLAGCAALVVVFTSTWWDQSSGFEVYSLHAVWMPVVTLLFLRFVDDEIDRSNDSAAGRRWYGMTKAGASFALALGLSFTNHMTTVLLGPAFLVYYFMSLPRARSVLRLLSLVPPFVLGLSPYLLLPIRAAAHPYFNWGDPETPKRFFDHVTGKQYQTWMFQSVEVYRQQAAFFFDRLPGEVAYVGLAIAALGVAHLARTSLRWSLFVALLFVGCITYSSGFSIMEIVPYYMTAVLAVGIWCLAGLEVLRKRYGYRAAIGVAAAVALVSAIVHYSENDESRNVLVEDMTTNMLGTLPPGALVLSSQWDFWVAGSFYLQAVEGRRPDVVVIDPELLRRSWYLLELEVDHPEVMRPIEAQVTRFRSELDKFEHGRPYESAVIESAYNGVINAIVETNIANRPVHVTAEVVPRIDPKFARAPYYLTLRLARDDAYLPQEFPRYAFHSLEGHVSPYTAKIHELYAQSAEFRMAYEARHGDLALARRYAEYAATFDPHYERRAVREEPLGSEAQIIGVIDHFADLEKRVSLLRSGAGDGRPALPRRVPFPVGSAP